MNRFDFIGIVCAVLLALFFFACVFAVVSNIMEYRRLKQLGFPDHVPTRNDAKKSAEEIGEFLWHRARPVGRTCFGTSEGFHAIKNDVCGNIFFGRCWELIDFIRLCHAVGCEVVVREVASSDTNIEENPERTQEVISRLREEQRRR